MAERRRQSNQDLEQQLLIATVITLLQTPRGRKTLLVLVVVGVIGYGCWVLYQKHHPVITHAGPTVRLATWNLHVFDPRPEIDLGRIAQIIEQNQFDLVAIQEVRGTGVEVDNLLNALGPPWRAARYSPTTGNHERFAFIFNGDHVQEIGPAQQLGGAGASVFNRTPYMDTFRAGSFQFTLLTVHLDWTDKRLREQEAMTLAQVAPDLESRAPDHHLIICGDFNEEHQHGNLHYLMDEGWQELIHDGTNLSSTEDFDNFLIEPRYFPQFTAHSGVVRFDQTYQLDRSEAVRTVSDHRPAYADFATN